MIGNVNFTSLGYRNISPKSKTEAQQNQAATVSNPVSENKGTYPLTDARNVLVPSVSFNGAQSTGTTSGTGPYKYVADPADGQRGTTGLSNPIRNINLTNFRPSGTEPNAYIIEDPVKGVTIECLGKVNPKNGKLKMKELKSVTVKKGNNPAFTAEFLGKMNTGANNNTGDKKLSENEVHALLTAFVEATTGFCQNHNTCNGMKSLAKENSAGDKIYPRIANGKTAKFELKILDTDECSRKCNFGDMRFFAYQYPKFDPTTNSWKICWDSWERHSSLHHNKW